MDPIELPDRLLWPDGDFAVDPANVTDFIFKLSGKGLEHLRVTHLTPDISDYNLISDRPLTVKGPVEPTIFPPKWILPDKYKYMNLDEYLIGLTSKVAKDSLYEARLDRLAHEIWLFKEISLDNVLRCLIYIVDTMKEKGVVKGVGRGSSCSSYILYLIGLHSVDPVKYDIDINDFIKLQGN